MAVPDPDDENVPRYPRYLSIELADGGSCIVVRADEATIFVPCREAGRCAYQLTHPALKLPIEGSC
ncbi:MAG: hypothetical protein WBF47_27360 [Xanthobacteraceae bacterium]